jgi:hypothetical protein
MSHQRGQVVPGIEISGVDWISVTHLGNYGSRQLRLIHNASGIHIKPWGRWIEKSGEMVMLAVNDGDLMLHFSAGGITVPSHGIYFPPGSLQIIVDEHGKHVIDDTTTLPLPVYVPSVPCSGWCKKQHIYIEHGMTEKAVIFFNGYGWPIACRENVLNEQERTTVRWWRFDYSRPAQEVL